MHVRGIHNHVLQTPFTRPVTNFLLLATLLISLGLVNGCGSGYNVIATSSGTAVTLNAGQAIQIPQTAAQTSKWVLSGIGCSDTSCGTIVPSSGSVTYTAPPKVDSQIHVTAATDDTNGKFEVTVNPELKVNATLDDAVVDTAYKTTVSTSGGSNPTHLTLASGTLPDGMQFNASTGLLSGTPKTDGDYPVTFQATDASAAGTATTLQRTFRVRRRRSQIASINITTSSLDAGTVNIPYSAELAASGGTTPYTWTITSGSLPAGIALSSDGVLSGTPRTAGTASFTAQVTDSNGSTNSASLTLNILNNASPTTLTISSPATATVGTAYTGTIGVSGGLAPYGCSLASGSLPAGLALNGCNLTGTPTAGGNYTVAITATDASSPANSSTANITIKVVAAATKLAIGAPAEATLGQPYNSSISVSGGTGPYTCSITNGALPTGITQNNCALTGTPSASGTFSLAIAATDSSTPANRASATVSLVVDAAAGQLTITSPSTAIVGKTYSASIGISGGTAPYSCYLIRGTLPDGLSMNGCVLAGIPTTAGSYSLRVRVSDSSATTISSSADIVVTVAAASVSLAISSPATATVGTAYSSSIGVSGGTAPYTCSLMSGTLPSGITQKNCTLAGTPSTSGTFSLGVKVTDSSSPANNTTATLSLVVNNAAGRLNITAPPAATVGKTYSGSIGVTGGTAPYTCSIASGTVPAGLSLNGCTFTGTPTTAGTYSLGVKASDSSATPITTTGNITVTINAAPSVTLTLSSPPSATVGTNYTGTIGVSGGTAPYTCALASGTAPAGLTLNGCTLTGTPTTAGSFVLSIKATDASSPANSTTANVTVVVNSAASTSQPGTPHINYTDLNVGSGTGGDTGNGVYVRIFGNHFGSSQGSSNITLGNGSLITNCGLCSWGDTQIIAQIGSAASTGNIVATVNGLQSNGVPFTVTPTTILFVSPNGSDSNSGSFASPFKTWRAAFNSVTSNDSKSPSQNTVIYLEPGTDVTFDDGRSYKAAISTDLGGTSATSQLSIVGYPGTPVTVGSTSITNGVKGWGKFVTIANLNIIGQVSAIDAEAGNTRIINNSISCPAPPSGVGGTACVLGETTDPTETWVFQGNNVHDTGGNVDKTYHAVYFSSNVNHADVGWNNVGQNFKGYCRGIMFHATLGNNQYDLHIHDNVVTNSYCDGIALASVNPSMGTVEVYNNVVTNTALASNPYGVANEAGIAINTDSASGGSSGNVEVYNNTVVNAGAYTVGNQNGCFGVVESGAGMHLTNNICSQPSASQPYVEKGSTNVSGSNNLWFGAGAAPSWDSAPITLDPLLSALYSLLGLSPASGAGTTSMMSPFDIIGTPRGSRPSVGAYQ